MLLTNPYDNKVSNLMALAYVNKIKVTKPILWKFVRQQCANNPSALSSVIVKTKCPVFIKKLVSLCNGNKLLAKATILTLKSNLCSECGNPAALPGIFCSKKCSWADGSRHQRRKETFIANFGVSHPRKLKSQVDKTNATCLARYGGGHNGNAEVRAKTALAMQAKYGEAVTWPSQIPGVYKDRWKKSEQTALNNYGVTHHMKDSESFPRNRMARFSIKTWVDCEGEEHKVQGFEPQAMDYFQSLGYGPFNTQLKPRTYVKDGKTKSYYPDFLFADSRGNHVYVEVKSEWTCNPQNKEEFRTNLLKFAAMNAFCKARGYTFLLAICTRDFGATPTVVKFPDKAKILACY
jgi:hypothetical protein